MTEGTERQFADFAKQAKALFGAAARVASLGAQMEQALAGMAKQVRSLYAGGDSPLAGPVAATLDAFDDDEPRFLRDFSAAWADAAARYRSAFRSGFGDGDGGDSAAAFCEQRLDGLDGATAAFLRLVQTWLPARRVGDVGAALDEAALLAEALPSPRDCGTSAAASLGAALAQRLPAHYLRMFAAASLSEENVDFVLALRAVAAAQARGMPQATVRALARRTLARFVVTASSAQVNVSAKSCERMVVAVEREGPVDVAALASVEQEVVQLMVSGNMFEAFKASPFWPRLVRRLTPLVYAKEQKDKHHKKQQQQQQPQQAQPLQPPPPPPPLPPPQQQQQQSTFKPAVVVADATMQRARQERMGRRRMSMAVEGPSIFEVLSNKPLLRELKLWLRERGADRPLAFWKEAERFAKADHGSGREMRRAAVELYEAYIMPNEDELSIGISPETQKTLYKALYENDGTIEITSSMFKKAQQEAMEMLNLTLFSQFLISDRWRPIYAQEKAKATYQTLLAQIQRVDAGKLLRHDSGGQQQLQAPSSPLGTPPATKRSDGTTSPPAATVSSPGLPHRIEKSTSASSLLRVSAESAVPPVASSPPVQRPLPLTPATPPTASSSSSRTPDASASSQPKGQIQMESEIDSSAKKIIASQQELRAMYQQMLLPQFEAFAQKLDAISTVEAIAALRPQIDRALAIRSVLKDVPLPTGTKTPDIVVVHENPKFVAFKQKLIICLWEVRVKLAHLAALLERSAAAEHTLADQLVQFWDIFRALATKIAQN